MEDSSHLFEVIRDKLHIPQCALTDYEIQTVHGEIDLDQSLWYNKRAEFYIILNTLGAL